MAQTEDARTEAAAPEPRGELSIRTLAMPADTNQNGDIFGGWVLGQMDVAGGIFASKIARPLRDHRGRRHDVPQAGLRRRRGVRLCRPDPDRHNLHHGAGRGLAATAMRPRNFWSDPWVYGRGASPPRAADKWREASGKHCR